MAKTKIMFNAPKSGNTYTPQDQKTVVSKIFHILCNFIAKFNLIGSRNTLQHHLKPANINTFILF